LTEKRLNDWGQCTKHCVEIKKWEREMKQLTKEESKKEKKPFEVLSKDELNFIRGGDQPNVENGDDK
jgi:hypothetical protein